MQTNAEKDLIISATMEIIQNVLPTKITSNWSAAYNDDFELTTSLSNDLAEDKLIQQFLRANRQTQTDAKPPYEQRKSPTFYIRHFLDGDNGEFTKNVKISKETIKALVHILHDLSLVEVLPIAGKKLLSLEEFTILSIYILMTDESIDTIEGKLHLKQRTLERILKTFCKAISQNKSFFIRWPNDEAKIEKKVQQFDQLKEFGRYDFYNIFGALGTTEINVCPALVNHLTITTENDVNEGGHTPVKLQCCCDSRGILLDCYVNIPQTEREIKNSAVFEVNPLRDRLEAIKSKENYVVADQTLSEHVILMTPHDANIENADAFNKALESKRKIVDKMFAIMKSGFPTLNTIELREIDEICQLVDTVCALHNFFVMQKDLCYLGYA